jgi:hypothetical protein
VIVRDIYVLSSNDLTKFADRAAYQVTAQTMRPTRHRVPFAAPPLRSTTVHISLPSV